ncbi:MAG: hypothetical protein PQJ50_04640 [Spirochaetales bacterium]|nr:hypothetical protein [Spirochaetales bacterium]
MPGVLRLTVLLALVFMLGSCSSSPEKVDSGDCLLVIPTEFYQQQGSDPVRSYYIRFSHDEREYQIPGDKSGTLTVRLNGPDNKLLSVTSRVTNPKHSGKDFTSEYNLTLPYKSGHVVISSFKFIQRTVIEDGTTVTRFYIDETTEAERMELLSRL